MISKILSRSLNRGLTLNIKRYFDLHEYQSKDLMRKYNILVQRGNIATTPEEAKKVAQDLNVKDGDLILKAQVHAGGRGKGTFCNLYRHSIKRNERRCPNPKNPRAGERKN